MFIFKSIKSKSHGDLHCNISPIPFYIMHPFTKYLAVQSSKYPSILLSLKKKQLKESLQREEGRGIIIQFVSQLGAEAPSTSTSTSSRIMLSKRCPGATNGRHGVRSIRTWNRTGSSGSENKKPCIFSARSSSLSQ